MCRGAAAGAAIAIGSVIVLCAVALVLKKTNLVPRLQEGWRRQPYEAVSHDNNRSFSLSSIALGDIRIDHDSGSEIVSSARSRSPNRTRM